MEFFNRLIEVDPGDERWALFPWLPLFFLCLLAAIGCLFWWILFYNGTGSASSGHSSPSTPRPAPTPTTPESDYTNQTAHSAPAASAPITGETDRIHSSSGIAPPTAAPTNINRSAPPAPDSTAAPSNYSQQPNEGPAEGTVGRYDTGSAAPPRPPTPDLKLDNDELVTPQDDTVAVSPDTSAAGRSALGTSAAGAAAIGTVGAVAGATAIGADTTDRSWQMAESFAGESVETNKRFGVVYNQRPAAVDDLTEINGIGSSLESRLNEQGIFRFKQIADWDQHNINEVGQHLGLPHQIERNEWVPQAKKLAAFDHAGAGAAVEEHEPILPDANAYLGFENKYAGEDIGIDNKLGVLFNTEANCEDDLTKIKGIGKVLNRTLNENGVYRFQQIADWNDYNVWSFNRIISFPGRIQRDEWINQAEALALTSRCLSAGSASVSQDDLQDVLSEEFYGEDVQIHEPFGIIYRTVPAVKDNLQKIHGVGPVLEDKLHNLGVFRYKQIANWPDDAIDQFQQQLSFPDRIRRDDWVGQCEKFIKA